MALTPTITGRSGAMSDKTFYVNSCTVLPCTPARGRMMTDTTCDACGTSGQDAERDAVLGLLDLTIEAIEATPAASDPVAMIVRAGQLATLKMTRAAIIAGVHRGAPDDVDCVRIIAEEFTK